MGIESGAMGFLLKSGAFIAIVAVFIYACFPGEIMTGISSDIILSGWQLQLAVTGFCVSNVPAKFLKEEYSQDIGGDFDFAVDGDVENEDYNKGSIYSLLYALYANVGTVQSDLGVPYEFTFNTWGISPSPYPREDPQRHGKAAYSGLVHLPAVKTYLAEVTNSPKIVEIGCGTGAGANLITREILKDAEYLALDMQMAAIKTCKKKHGNVTNPNLKCVHVPAGVGNNGNTGERERHAYPRWLNRLCDHQRDTHRRYRHRARGGGDIHGDQAHLEARWTISVGECLANSLLDQGL